MYAIALDLDTKKLDEHYPGQHACWDSCQRSLNASWNGVYGSSFLQR